MHILVISEHGKRQRIDCGAVVLFERYGNPIAAAMDLPSGVTVYSDGRDPEFSNILKSMNVETREYVIISPPCKP